MKKIFIAIILTVFLMSFSGCKKEQAKVVKIGSNPQGATVFIDGEKIGKTPLEYSLAFGLHQIRFTKDGYYDVEDKLNVQEGSKNIVFEKVLTAVQYLPLPLQGGEIIHFDDKPKIRNNYSDFTYSGIYLYDAVDVSGITKLDSFDIVFPSGKKVHFETGNPDKDGTRKFSKIVTFDELGRYKIFSGKEQVTFGCGGYTTYQFDVLYKTTLLEGTLTLGNVIKNFKNGQLKNAIIVPKRKDVKVKLMLTSGKGSIAKNKPIGKYDLKTDENGIVTFTLSNKKSEQFTTLEVDGKPVDVIVYGDILGWVCNYSTFDKNGKLIETTLSNATKDTFVKVEEGDIYMPFDSSGLSIGDLGFEGLGYGITIHPKNPAIIYTDAFVSVDGGNTFQRFGEGLTFNVIAVDPLHPEVIYGWAEDNPSNVSALFKSDDYGAHFRRIKDIGYVSRIVVDPKESNTVYLTSDKELMKTTDGGKTWESVFSSSINVWINPKNTNVIYSNGGGFLKSQDGGKTWRAMNLMKDKPAEWNEALDFAFDPTNPDIVYSITYAHIFKSEDGGESWVMTTTRYFQTLSTIKIDPANPNRIFLGSFEGVLESEDGGKNFQNIGFYLSSMDVSVNSQGEVFACVNGIPFKMTSDKNWVPLGEIFIKNGPKWKTIDGKFYIAVNTISSDKVGAWITQNDITFYKMCDMQP